MKYKVGQTVILKQYKSYFRENELRTIQEVSYEDNWYWFNNTLYVAGDEHIKGLAFKQYLAKL